MVFAWDTAAHNVDHNKLNKSNEEGDANFLAKQS